MTRYERNRMIIAAMVGNAFEYYDFTIYSVFAITIGKTFFPSYNEISQILLSLMVFAVGFFMRPLGGIVFGHIGDKAGRKIALTSAIMCMAIPTLIIGLLPGFDHLGLLAPILLVLLRLIQGLSIGGEGAGAAVFLLEHQSNLKPGIIGGTITASNIVGVFIAILVGIIINLLAVPQSFAWRVAFIFGAFLGFFGFYLRLKTAETPIFQHLQQQKKIAKIPFLTLIKTAKRPMFLVCVLGGISGATAYIVMVYVNIFFNKTLGLSGTLALSYTSVGILSYIVFLPVFGKLSDRLGYGKTTLMASMGITSLALPLFLLITTSELYILIPTLLVLGALAAFICAPAYPLMMQLFLPEARYSGISFSFNTGIALFGGTVPLIATLLTQKTGLIYAPAFYLMGLGALFTLCYLLTFRGRHPEQAKDFKPGFMPIIPTDSRLSY